MPVGLLEVDVPAGEHRIDARMGSTPDRVADCVAAMKATGALPVTVKCRLGVDEQDTQVALDAVATFPDDRGVYQQCAHLLMIEGR